MVKQSWFENVVQFCIFSENGSGTRTVLGFKMQAREFIKWCLSFCIPAMVICNLACSFDCCWTDSLVELLFQDLIPPQWQSSAQSSSFYMQLCLWNVSNLCCFSLSRLSQLWWWQLRDQMQMQLPQTRWMILSSILSHFSQVSHSIAYRINEPGFVK